MRVAGLGASHLTDGYRSALVSVQELRSQRLQLSERLAALDNEESARAKRETERRAVVSTVAAWDEASLLEQAVLRALIDRIVILPAKSGKKSGPRFDPARIRVEWKISGG